LKVHDEHAMPKSVADWQTRFVRVARAVIKWFGVLYGLSWVAVFLSPFYFVFALHREPPHQLYSAFLLMGAGLILYFFYGGGAQVYLYGFSAYRQFRQLENLPRTTIRSAPMGLVDIEGKAADDAMVAAPLTYLPCCGYRIKVEGYEERDVSQPDGTTTRQTVTAFLAQIEEGKLYLEDETGRIRIDMKNLEFDMWAHASRIVEMRPGRPGSRMDNWWESRGKPSDTELRSQAKAIIT
jgi:hypothetical protein